MSGIRTRTDRGIFAMAALQLYCAYTILSHTEYPSLLGRTPFRLLWLGMLALLGVYTLLQEDITRLQILVSAGLLSLAFAVTRVVESNRIFLQTALILLLAGVPFRRIVKNVLAATALWTLFVVLSCAAGVLRDYTYVHKTGFDTLTAHACGFSYYSYFGYMTMALTLMYLYLRGRRCTWAELALLAVVHAVLYYFVHTTMLVLLTTEGFLVLFIICVRWELIRFEHRIWEVLGMLLPWGMFGGIWYLVWSFQHKNHLFAVMEEHFPTLLDRLNFSVEAYNLYGIRLFGNHVVLEGNSYVNYEQMNSTLYIDSNYVYLPIVYGAVFTAVFLLLLSLLFRYIYSLHRPGLFLWFGTVLVISAVNNFLLHVFANTLILLTGEMLASLGRRLETRRLDPVREEICS